MNRREAIAALVALPAATTVRAASVDADDVIVIELAHEPEEAAIEHIRSTIAGIWPGRRCLVVAGVFKIVRQE